MSVAFSSARVLIRLVIYFFKLASRIAFPRSAAIPFTKLVTQFLTANHDPPIYVHLWVNVYILLCLCDVTEAESFPFIRHSLLSKILN